MTLQGVTLSSLRKFPLNAHCEAVDGLRPILLKIALNNVITFSLSYFEMSGPLHLNTLHVGILDPEFNHSETPHL